MKNIMYGYANEGAGLTYTGAIRVDKGSETHYIFSCACALLTTDGGRRPEIQSNARVI